jgi:hypothetical protein
MRTGTHLLPIALLVLAGCSAAPAAPPWSYAPSTAAPVVATRVVEVYKSPTCSCCHEWEAYLRAHGYTVRSIPTVDMEPIKVEWGLPEAARSCHTAVVDGYAIEGHVPVAAIDDLLSRRPAIDGIALPGMPPGSPGMPGVQPAAFEILAIDNGTTTAFGSY